MVKRARNMPSNTAVGYVRRSTDKQEQSIPDQKKAISAFAAANDLKLLKFYTDDAISGTSTVKRKAFLQMLEDAESNLCEFKYIIVYDVKRFGRLDNDEAGYFRHKFKMCGVEISYATENFNGDASDDLLRPVKQWQARQESKDLSKVTIRGLLTKSEGGWWMGGTPPYGYDLRYENSEAKFLFTVRYMPDRTKLVLDEEDTLARTLSSDESIQVTKKDRAKLVPSEFQRVEGIKNIFDQYTNIGKGFKAIAADLNNNNVPTARGPKWAMMYSGRWNATAVRYIIENPLYSGDMVWNRRTDARFHKISNGIAVDRKDIHGHRLVPNDKTDWIIIRDTHTGIISRRQFEAAKNKRLNKIESIQQRGTDPRLKTHGKTWDGKRSRFILSGLITCSKCNSRYQGFTSAKGKTNADGTRCKNFYYACGGYISRGNSVCQLNSIPQDILEQTIIDNILEFYDKYLYDDGRGLLERKVKSQIQLEDIDFKSAKQRIHEQLAGNDQIINNLLDNLTAQNRDFVDKRLDELKIQKIQFQSRLEELERLESSQDEILNIVSQTLTFISSLEYTLKNGLPQEKLVAIRQCIQRIWVDKEAGKLQIDIYSVPAGNIKITESITAELQLPTNSIVTG